MTATEMKTFLRDVLTATGEEKSVAACESQEANTLVLSSAAFGGGGQEGVALLDELQKLGVVLKYAALHGKQVTYLPQE